MRVLALGVGGTDHLAVLDAEESITVVCTSSNGDSEKVLCFPVGRNVRVVLGSVMTAA